MHNIGLRGSLFSFIAMRSLKVLDPRIDIYVEANEVQELIGRETVTWIVTKPVLCSSKILIQPWEKSTGLIVPWR
jgi:hypothetical protein